MIVPMSIHKSVEFLQRCSSKEKQDFLHLLYVVQPLMNSKINFCYLFSGPYLLTIKKRRLVGIFNGHEIWQIKETDIVPFPKTMLHLTEEQVLLHHPLICSSHFCNAVSQLFLFFPCWVPQKLSPLQSYQIRLLKISFYLAKNLHVNFDSVWKNLCICLAKLYFDSVKCGLKELKSHHLYPYHLTLWVSPLSKESPSKVFEIEKGPPEGFNGTVDDTPKRLLIQTIYVP